MSKINFKSFIFGGVIITIILTVMGAVLATYYVGSNNINMQGSKIENLGMPTVDSDAATKEYVDVAVTEASGGGSDKNVFDSWNIGGAAPSYSKCPFSVMSGNDITFAVLDDGSTCTGSGCPDYCSPIHCLSAANKTGCDGFYVVNGCGYNTVLDTLTDTCFMRDWGVGGSKQWEDAVNYCKGLALCNDGTYVEGDCSSNNGVYNDDWELPTRHELLRVVDYGLADAPMIVGRANDIFENVQNAGYWSSSRRSSSRAWGVGLASGYVFNLGVLTGNRRVVCVSRN